MRNVTLEPDALNERRSAALRILVISLLLIPASAAVMLVAAKSSPASVQPTPAASKVPSAPAAASDTIEAPAATTTTPDQTSAGTSINFSATQTSPATPPTVDLRVNDQPVQVPDDANFHKVIQQGNTTTTLDVSNSSANSQGSTHSSTNINVNASTQAVHTEEGP